MKSHDRIPDSLKALVLALALSGYSCGRQGSREADHSLAGPAPQEVRADSSREGCLNLNTARLDELMALPGIGEKIARRIIEHREEHGPFDRPEEVIIIEGISELKYRAIASEVCAR